MKTCRPNCLFLPLRVFTSSYMFLLLSFHVSCTIYENESIKLLIRLCIFTYFFFFPSTLYSIRNLVKPFTYSYFRIHPPFFYFSSSSYIISSKTNLFTNSFAYSYSFRLRVFFNFILHIKSTQSIN